MVIIGKCQSDLVTCNTKEKVLAVCDQPYHTNNTKVQKGEKTKVLQNCANKRDFFAQLVTTRFSECIRVQL